MPSGNQHWQQIASGNVQVVVGARSRRVRSDAAARADRHRRRARDLGSSRFDAPVHTREVARRRAELEQVPLILGTATPTLESWNRALANTDELLRMPKRVEGLPCRPS